MWPKKLSKKKRECCRYAEITKDIHPDFCVACGDIKTDIPTVVRVPKIKVKKTRRRKSIVEPKVDDVWSSIWTPK
jgi:hypothetical protein